MLKLSRQDSVDFANNYFRPSKEYIEHVKSNLERINSNIQINPIEDGYEAEIRDLDLSFLKKSD